MLRVLVVDNRDSFVYNLVQLLHEDGRCCYEVHREGELPLERLDEFNALLLSPGPGLPGEAPEMMQLISQCAPTHSILGICLGHQAIAQAYGAELKQLGRPLHGHSSRLEICSDDPLLSHLPPETTIGRYHSWAVDEGTMPQELIPLAWASDPDGARHIMALRHRQYLVYGLQFHPESMITSHGAMYLSRWLDLTLEYRPSSASIPFP